MEDRAILFFEQLNVSPRTKLNYKTAINSSFVKRILKGFGDTDNLFDITDLEKLWVVYSHINLHPVNLANHRTYSAAIMKYIKFLNGGKKYGKRIDYKKPKGKRKQQRISQ